ncbi:B-cell receptor CD22-like [Cheilinus undulatus]|uniref:B-cell receptor CD22-like n=1 Tax=Cheilinus undulatus TaxID=241271 RepID=UPI001BD41719|nr:B-cell receptor CD22-like [Cheilinus undulatus]
MFPACMLLSAFFLSGALAKCPASANDLIIDTPETMEALNGSCLHIPCTFRPKKEEIFDSTQLISGFWLKQGLNGGKDSVVFKSDGTIRVYPMNITGNLNLKQCTTLFSNLIPTYEGTYFFRMESEAFKATAVRDCLQIKVRDSPPEPIMEIPVDLKENVSVNITCSAVTPCPLYPPKLTWNVKDSHNTKEENQDGTFTTRIQETITLTDKHDGYNISCSSTYPVNEGRDNKTAEETKTLSVSYAPKNTSVSISPPGLLSAGVNVTLSCSSRAKPRVSSFTWFKMSSDGPMNVSEGEIYSFNVTEGGVYFCVAKNDLGDERSSEIHLHVEVFLPGPSQSSQQWGAVIGGIFGIIAFICLAVFVWRFSSVYTAQKQTQSPTSEEASVEGAASKNEGGGEENIHYGEIDFSKLRQNSSCGPLNDRGQQQETLYAQVKVSANNQTQTADGPEELYSRVGIKPNRVDKGRTLGT